MTTWGGEGFSIHGFAVMHQSVYIHKCVSPPAGWSVEALQEWGSYMKLAIPSTMMTCFEWWIYEFGGFFAGKT